MAALALLSSAIIAVKFIGSSSGSNLDAEELVINRHNGACLHRLSLSRVTFRLLDLHNAVSLTS